MCPHRQRALVYRKTTSDVTVQLRKTENIKQTDKPFAEHLFCQPWYMQHRRSAESALAGIPTFRFQPVTRMARHSPDRAKSAGGET